MADALRHFDGDRYELSDFVVMPNHVHVLFAPGSDQKLADIIQSWKRHSARMINVRMGASGRLWQPDYWDRLIRSQRHFNWVKGYITANPKDWMTAWASAALPRTLNRPAMINIEVEAKKVVELT